MPYEDPESQKQAKTGWAWQYRLRDRLKAERWEKFKVEMQKGKEQFISDMLQNLAIDTFGFFIAKVVLTENFRGLPLSDQVKVCSTVIHDLHNKLSELDKDLSKKWDERTEESKAKFDSNLDEIFEKVMVEYKTKCFADPQFRIKTEQQIREQVEKIEPQIPKFESSNIKNFVVSGVDYVI
jgi:hypothetical protein